MLRKFKITIDGKEYLVEMEEIGGTAPTAAPVTQQAPVAAQTTPQADPEATQPAVAAEPTPAPATAQQRLQEMKP